MNYTFFGSNYRVLEAILKVVPISSALVEKRSINKELATLTHMRGIDLKVLDGRPGLDDANIGGDLGICCGFGIIFREKEIAAFEKGIINIHTGKLPDNRGRHPISWAFLMNEFKIWVSIHAMNDQIDQGLLLHEFYVDRSLDDDLSDIEGKIALQLPTELEVALERIANQQHVKLGPGKYNKSLQKALKVLDPTACNSKYFLNAIRSQKVYGGIDVYGKSITEAYIYSPDYYDDSFSIVECNDSIKLMMR